jgi:hypothetical protein
MSQNTRKPKITTPILPGVRRSRRNPAESSELSLIFGDDLIGQAAA